MPKTTVPIELPDDTKLLQLAKEITVPGPIFCQDLQLDADAYREAATKLQRQLFGNGKDRNTGLVNAINNRVTAMDSSETPDGPVYPGLKFDTNQAFVMAIYEESHALTWVLIEEGGEINLRLEHEIMRYFIPQFLYRINAYLFEVKREKARAAHTTRSQLEERLEEIKHQEDEKAEAFTARWRKLTGQIPVLW